MDDPRLRLGIGLLAFATCAFPLAAQEVDPEEQAQTIMAGLGKAGIKDAWTHVQRLIRLGEDAADTITGGLKSDNPVVRYGCAKALLTLGAGEEYAGRVLLELVRSDVSLDLRSAAVDLLGRERVTTAGAELAELLKQPMPLTLKARVARAVYRTNYGSGRIRRGATDLLHQMLESRKLDNRAAAALILADLGRMRQAREVLEELREEPTARGRMAQLYLDLALANDRLRSARLRDPELSPTGKDREYRLDVLAEIIKQVRDKHQDGNRFTDDELIEYAARGLLESLDPHSTFLTAKQMADWDFDLNPTYAGIGAYVNLDDNKRIFIVRPIYSGPAYKKKLKSGDRILKVDGWRTQGHALPDITKRLKGPAGTTVKLQIYRRGWSKPL